MSYLRISHYMGVAFIGALGLFNSSKLEMRQLTNTNAELLFQNGQIISSALIFMCIAGIIAEFMFMKNNKHKIKLVVQRKDAKDTEEDCKEDSSKVFGVIPSPTLSEKKPKKETSEKTKVEA